MESQKSPYQRLSGILNLDFFRRVGTYAFGRILTIAVTIVTGVFITVVMANKNNGIDMSVSRGLYVIAYREAWNTVNYSAQNSLEIQQQISRRLAELEQEAGMYDPFLFKHLRWTWNALRLQVGDTVFTNTSVAEASSQDRNNIRLIILDRLPNTLAIVGLADLFVFAVGIPLSLYLSRRYGTWFDKLLNILSPLSSVPSWVFGVLLIILFAVMLKWLPPGGMIENPIPKIPMEYWLSRLKHMVLPVAAIFLNLLFQLVYSWRNFFMIYSNEDYVEFGVAQGLPWRNIEKNYILRPALPFVLTSFALTLVTFWQMTIALEVVFNWDGIGNLYINSLPNFLGSSMFPGEMGVTVGIVVLFAYFLGLVVLILDVAYAVVDPRIRLGPPSERVSTTHKQPRSIIGNLLDRYFRSGKYKVGKLLLPGAVVFLVGCVIGFWIGRQAWLAEKQQSLPADLANEYQLEYLEMSLESFALDQNSEFLYGRFGALGQEGAQVFRQLIELKSNDLAFQDKLAFVFDNFEYVDQLAVGQIDQPPSTVTENLSTSQVVALGLSAVFMIYFLIAGKRGRITPLNLLFGMTGFLLFGLMLGRGVSRVVSPPEFTDVSPADLQHEYQVEYVSLIINSYSQNNDRELVYARISTLGDRAESALGFVKGNPIVVTVSPLNLQLFFMDFEEFAPENEDPDNIGASTLEPREDLPAKQVEALTLADLAAIFTIFLSLASILYLVRRIRSPQLESLADLFRRQWKAVKRILGGMVKYPSAVIGMSIIGLLVAGSIYAIIRYPYQDIGEDWYTDTSEVTKYVPKVAKPEWVNQFRRQDYAETIVIDSHLQPELKVVEAGEKEGKKITFTYAFDFPYADFPSEAILYFDTNYENKKPFVLLRWLTPDGREFDLKNFSIKPSNYLKLEEIIDVRQLTTHQISYQTTLTSVGKEPVLSGLFMDPNSTLPQVVPGKYILEMEVLTFEEQSDVDIEFVLLGTVYGLAGTDIMRRDLLIPLLWGMPFALLLGLLGAVLTTFVSMTLAAVGVWYGGWVDNLVQRVTEANMILPVVAIAVLFYAFYGLDMWIVLLIIVVLNAFGSPIKSFRSAFIQVREAAYIEAAQAYGAKNSRIIFRYMVPRILPVLIPQLVTLVPSFIFLEATLGILKVESFATPTWGKIIHEALAHGAVWGSKFWVLEPIGLLLLTGFAFSMMGAALERVLNPRLQEGK